MDLYNANVLREYAVTYTNNHKSELSRYSLDEFVKNFQVSQNMLSEINKKAAALGIKYNEKEFNRSKEFIQTQVKALIARAIWKDSDGKSNSFYKVVNQNDESVKTALKHFDRAAKL